MTTTPKHEYEITEGTKPAPHAAHQPRTIKHTTKRDTDSDLSMMTEIGDGVFVQWTSCRKCHKQVYDCQCQNGPVEPAYMKKWRDDRFKHDLNTRPDPSYDLLPSVIEWVEERGYKVTKKREKKESEEGQAWTQAVQPGEPFTVEGDHLCDEECGDDSHPKDAHLIEEEYDEADIADRVDGGLDNALERVRAARNVDDVDAGF